MVRAAALIAIALAGCQPVENTYTLYRSSMVAPGVEGDAARIQVATFDAKETADYNRENCDIVRGLMVAQPGVTVRYWCEKGRFRS